LKLVHAIATQSTCPVCRSGRWIDILESQEAVVHIGRLFATESEARNAPRGDILLALCQECGYVGNRAYIPIEDAFAPGYDTSIHHSGVYLQFLSDLADDLVARHQLEDKTVLEVACGPGFFLRLMLERGCGAGIGVDPSLERAGNDAIGSKPITWIRDFYDKRYAHLPVDMVICRQALHTLPDPRAFVESVHDAAENRPDVRIYFEVVNANNLFRKGIVWQLLYEYRSYFTENSLTRLFRECGLRVTRVGPCYADGQYLSIEGALDSNGVGGHPVPRVERGEDFAEMHRFADTLRGKVSYWRNRLRELLRAGRKVAAWGAAGRGITFLNLVDPDGEIRHIVEINPARQGKYIPGTGALVVAPESLVEYRPDVIILTNATYENEIKQQVNRLGLDCEFLLA
jgi:SAM-dependent methyltransferase